MAQAPREVRGRGERGRFIRGIQLLDLPGHLIGRAVYGVKLRPFHFVQTNLPIGIGWHLDASITQGCTGPPATLN